MALYQRKCVRRANCCTALKPAKRRPQVIKFDMRVVISVEIGALSSAAAQSLLKASLSSEKYRSMRIYSVARNAKKKKPRLRG